MDILLPKDFFRQQLPAPDLPRSKSIVIRYMIYHYLKTGALLPIYPDDPQDIKTVHHALTCISQNVEVSFSNNIINVKDCGAAFRFLLPILAATKGGWILTGTPRLLDRPIEPLITTLCNMGAQIERQRDGSLFIQGSYIHAPRVSIDCQQSSQFASALLLSQKLLGIENLTIIPNFPPSNSYIRMTKKVIKQYDQSGVPAKIENDWSAAAFWYAWAYLNDFDQLSLSNLSLQSIQGDRIATKWFAKLGINSVQQGENILLTSGKRRTENGTRKMRAYHYNLSQHIDLAPLMISLTAMNDSIGTISGIETLNYKESKRRDELISSLSIIYNFQYVSESLTKTKKKALPSFPNLLTFDAHQDHRLVMSYALWSSVCNVRIIGAEAIEKSYPQLLNPISAQVR